MIRFALRIFSVFLVVLLVADSTLSATITQPTPLPICPQILTSEAMIEQSIWEEHSWAQGISADLKRHIGLVVLQSVAFAVVYKRFPQLWSYGETRALLSAELWPDGVVFWGLAGALGFGAVHAFKWFDRREKARITRAQLEQLRGMRRGEVTLDYRTLIVLLPSVAAARVEETAATLQWALQLRWSGEGGTRDLQQTVAEALSSFKWDDRLKSVYALALGQGIASYGDPLTSVLKAIAENPEIPMNFLNPILANVLGYTWKDSNTTANVQAAVVSIATSRGFTPDTERLWAAILGDVPHTVYSAPIEMALNYIHEHDEIPNSFLAGRLPRFLFDWKDGNIREAIQIKILDIADKRDWAEDIEPFWDEVLGAGGTAGSWVVIPALNKLAFKRNVPNRFLARALPRVLKFTWKDDELGRIKDADQIQYAIQEGALHILEQRSWHDDLTSAWETLLGEGGPVYKSILISGLQSLAYRPDVPHGFVADQISRIAEFRWGNENPRKDHDVMQALEVLARRHWEDGRVRIALKEALQSLEAEEQEALKASRSKSQVDMTPIPEKSVAEEITHEEPEAVNPDKGSSSGTSVPMVSEEVRNAEIGRFRDLVLKNLTLDNKSLKRSFVKKSEGQDVLIAEFTEGSERYYIECWPNSWEISQYDSLDDPVLTVKWSSMTGSVTIETRPIETGARLRRVTVPAPAGAIGELYMEESASARTLFVGFNAQATIALQGKPFLRSARSTQSLLGYRVAGHEGRAYHVQTTPAYHAQGTHPIEANASQVAHQKEALERIALDHRHDRELLAMLQRVKIQLVQGFHLLAECHYDAASATDWILQDIVANEHPVANLMTIFHELLHLKRREEFWPEFSKVAEESSTIFLEVVYFLRLPKTDQDSYIKFLQEHPSVAGLHLARLLVKVRHISESNCIREVVTQYGLSLRIIPSMESEILLRAA